jgi:curved DNA-binding protein CbpA
MGQGQSQQVDSMYTDYIQKQQQMLYQQQQQINDLYQMNLQQQQQHQQHQQFQQTPPNIAFNQDYQAPDHSLRKLPSTKLDPYKILGLSKEFTENQLKKAYLKKAMKSHPDRGGSKKEFQKVSIAYTVLKKKLKEQGEIHHHNELKQNAKSFMGTQQQGGQNINMRDNFDRDLFNKIYEENKIEDAFDQGYGNWMNQNDTIASSQPKMFQGNFNKDMFNHEFEKYKQEQKQKMGTQITQYQEPQVRLSMKNQDSLVTLGQGKVSNFSGEVGNLGFTDYKAAFTVDSTLIDTSSIDINGRANSIKGVERERSNISYQLSPEDQQRVAYQEALQQKEERARIQRLQVYDQRSEDTYNKVHQLLLR